MLNTLLAAILCVTAGVEVGDAAPPLTASEWLNGTEPAFAGKPVMVEFWGTWCAPCVAAMPHVQDLWARYREQGLLVAAISWEEAAVMQPFLDKRGFTMLVGSDPTKACINAFGIDGWPTTFVLDRDGKVIYRGIPSGAEPFIQQALGLETSASALLSRCVPAAVSAAEGGAVVSRETLDSLVRNATHTFELSNWARGQGGVPSARAPKDAAAALTALVADPSGPGRAQALNDLAAVGATFDLQAWAQAELGRRFPFTVAELDELVSAERFSEAVQALISRHPAKQVVAKAKGDDALRDWCNERAGQYRENGIFLVLLGHWAFGEYQLEEIAFPTGTAAVSEKNGTQGFAGVLLNTGETLMQGDFPACIDAYLTTTLAVESLARRKLPDDLAKGAAKLHAEFLADLKKKHGTTKKKLPGDN